MRKTAVVICPGRGTYSKTELGYLKGKRAFAESLVQGLDLRLAALGEPTVTALDEAAVYSLRTHTPGEFASTLIYACSAADFHAIDLEQIEVVAVTGNSMGWYTALALGAALDESAAFAVIHGMGSMMRTGIIGGQLIYPVVGADWRPDPKQEALVERVLEDVKQQPGCEAYLSIRFGGYLIIGGNAPALAALMRLLPAVEGGKYPFILVNHAAFHTPMLREIAERGLQLLGPDLFRPPQIPLIDGRGVIWQPYSTDGAALRAYTLGPQVCETYDFALAVEVALKEFAPDLLILLGPGATSGGAIGQILIRHQWCGMSSKEDFVRRQEQNPVLIAMGRPEQAQLVAKR